MLKCRLFCVHDVIISFGVVVTCVLLFGCMTYTVIVKSFGKPPVVRLLVFDLNSCFHVTM